MSVSKKVKTLSAKQKKLNQIKIDLFEIGMLVSLRSKKNGVVIGKIKDINPINSVGVDGDEVQFVAVDVLDGTGEMHLNIAKIKLLINGGQQ